MKSAFAAEEEGDFATALQHWRRALDFRPDSPTVILYGGRAMAAAGELDEALKAVERYAAMGLTAVIDDEPAFAPLLDHPRFRAALRRMQASNEPVGSPEITRTLPVSGFFAEAIALDETNGDFYVTGFHDGSIMRLRQDEVTRLHQSELCVLGIAIDQKNRTLWAAATALPDVRPETRDREGSSELIRFDLDSGAIRTFASSMDGASQFGDLALLPDGTVLISDGKQSAILSFDPREERFLRWSPVELPSPQGIAVSEDGASVFVADYAAGFFLLTENGSSWNRLSGPDDLTTLGIDGLAWSHPYLIGVQNGVRPQRIIRLEVDRERSRILSWKILAASQPEFDEPTQGLVHAGRFHFLANSHWPHINDDPGENTGLAPPIVMAIPIEPPADPDQSRFRPPANQDRQPVAARAVLGSLNHPGRLQDMP